MLTGGTQQAKAERQRQDTGIRSMAEQMPVSLPDGDTYRKITISPSLSACSLV
jgi:hypothetical protein